MWPWYQLPLSFAPAGCLFLDRQIWMFETGWKTSPEHGIRVWTYFTDATSALWEISRLSLSMYSTICQWIQPKASRKQVRYIFNDSYNM
jgi:hypothetical protein